ncbi:hypothetical protein PCANB_001111 [Pneumocystis canis]|nr:hypothetical protein PCK1_001128 [Pneumocystis canis]KAG5437135.1 hypothetical protein PCANB_001111 [Pneumocystis canis]
MTSSLQTEGLTIHLSIPSVDTAFDPKPHTIYLLQVQLAIRFYVLKKRYSEFHMLHEQLLQVTGRSPPVALPPKHCLLNILSKPSLIEERRKKLEAYVIAIQCNEDSCWRSSPPWRQFLKFPVYHISRHTGLMTDSTISPLDQSWIRIFHETKSLLQEAKRRVSKQKCSEGSALSQTAWTTSTKSFCMIRTALERLSQDLDNIDTQVAIGERELWRRKDLLDEMKREYDFLEHITYVNDQIKQNILLETQSWQDHSAQMGRHKTNKTLETEKTRELNSMGLVCLQKNILVEQDEQLNSFLPILKKQKEMVAAIAEELDIQNDMLDELDENVQKTDTKLRSARKKCDQLNS